MDDIVLHICINLSICICISICKPYGSPLAYQLFMYKTFLDSFMLAWLWPHWWVETCSRSGIINIHQTKRLCLMVIKKNLIVPSSIHNGMDPLKLIHLNFRLMVPCIMLQFVYASNLMSQFYFLDRACSSNVEE
jgi:hypothetical protein